jgi:hypothetical protein
MSIRERRKQGQTAAHAAVAQPRSRHGAARRWSTSAAQSLYLPESIADAALFASGYNNGLKKLNFAVKEEA